MRRAVYVIAAVAMMLTAVAQATPTSPDVAILAAGRVRFVEGSGVRVTLGGTTVTPDLDSLVLVGATFQTGNSRLELQTLNGDLFWFDRGTDFDFEASDPEGNGTALFLGRGTLVVETAAPLNLITGAGTLLLPAGGTYSITKADPGKQRTAVATVAGPEPTVVNHATLFSKFSLGGEGDAGLLAWTRQRQEEWRATLVRADIFSHVDQLPPMVAHTGPDGERQWRRVTHAGPLPWLSGWLVDDLWVGGYDVGLLRAAAVLPAGLDHRSSFEIWLWFLNNRYNSLRWAWSVPLGWHAEWFWDPLAGSGPQFATALYFSPLPTWDWYANWLRESDWLTRRSRFSRRAAVPPGTRPVLSGVIPERAGKHPRVRLVDDARLRDRLRTDPGLGSLRRARSLDPRPVSAGRDHGGGGAVGGAPSARARLRRRVVRAPRAVSAPVVVAVPRSSATTQQ